MFYIDDEGSSSPRPGTPPGPGGSVLYDAESSSSSDIAIQQRMAKMKAAAQRRRGTEGMVMATERPGTASLSRPTTSSLPGSISTPRGEAFTPRDMSRPTTASSMSVVSQPTPATFARPSTAAGKERSEDVVQAEQELLSRGITPLYVPYAETAGGSAGVGLSAGGLSRDPARNVNTIDLTLDRRILVTKPSPMTIPSQMLHCYVRRTRDGIANKFHPKYFLHLTSNDTFLLAARKRKKNKSSNYLISLDHDDLARTGGAKFAKLRSNFVGTDFTMFEGGVNPKKMIPDGTSPSAVDATTRSQFREEQGAILYETNILGTKGPRKMSVLLPRVDDDGNRHSYRPLNESESMVERYRTNDTENMFVLKNKQPVWNEQLRAYVLNFNGRVTQASVKNFQLVDPEQPNFVYLQFGKVDENLFNLDFCGPLSILQAFGIALSAFDNKLACE